MNLQIKKLIFFPSVLLLVVAISLTIFGNLSSLNSSKTALAAPALPVGGIFNKFTFGTSNDASWQQGDDFNSAPNSQIIAGPWILSGYQNYHTEFLNKFSLPVNSTKIPYMYAYITAGMAKADLGIADCNVGRPAAETLCNKGANYIRNNEAKILQTYIATANSIKSSFGTTKPILIHLEPDFYQKSYNDAGFTQEGGVLTNQYSWDKMNQWTSAFKQVLPNAMLVMDISPWNSNLTNWSAGFQNFTYAGMVGKRFASTGDGSVANGIDGKTYAQMATATGKRLFINTAHGAGGGLMNYDYSWDLRSTLNDRYNDGVMGIIQSPDDKAGYNTKIASYLAAPVPSNPEVLPSSSSSSLSKSSFSSSSSVRSSISSSSSSLSNSSRSSVSSSSSISRSSSRQMEPSSSNSSKLSSSSTISSSISLNPSSSSVSSIRQMESASSSFKEQTPTSSKSSQQSVNNNSAASSSIKSSIQSSSSKSEFISASSSRPSSASSKSSPSFDPTKCFNDFVCCPFNSVVSNPGLNSGEQATGAFLCVCPSGFSYQTYLYEGTYPIDKNKPCIQDPIRNSSSSNSFSAYIPVDTYNFSSKSSSLSVSSSIKSFSNSSSSSSSSSSSTITASVPNNNNPIQISINNPTNPSEITLVGKSDSGFAKIRIKTPNGKIVVVKIKLNTGGITKFTFDTKTNKILLAVNSLFGSINAYAADENNGDIVFELGQLSDLSQAGIYTADAVIVQKGVEIISSSKSWTVENSENLITKTVTAAVKELPRSGGSIAIVGIISIITLVGIFIQKQTGKKIKLS